MRWISVKTRLPQKSDKYLVWQNKGNGIEYPMTINYSVRHNAWNAYDELNEPCDQKQWKSITHWAKITPPKGAKR